jgi:hypothetical protein
MTLTGVDHGPPQTTDNRVITYQTSGLTEGEYEITIEAERLDGLGGKGTYIENFIVDRTAPSISIDNPTEIQVGDIFLANESQIPISATVYDTSNVRSVRIDGQYTTYPYERTVYLPPNLQKSIAVIAEDEAGNENQDSVIVEYDSLAPLLSISFPRTGFSTRIDTITISGTYADKHIQYVQFGGDLLTVVNLANVIDSDTPIAYSQDVTLDSSQDGVKEIIGMARDIVGHLTSTSPVEVIYDTQAPTLLSVDPADLSVHRSISQIRAVLEESVYGVGLDLELSDISVTDQFNTEITGSTTGYVDTLIFTPSPQLDIQSPGDIVEYTVQITAVDKINNQQTYTTSFTINKEAPMISITNPIDMITYVNTSLQNIEGIVTPSSGRTLSSITIEGTEIIGTSYWDGISFTYPLTLVGGTQNIEIDAIDDLGNAAQNTRTYILDTTPPSITLNQITSPTSISTLNIEGTYSDVYFDRIEIYVNSNNVEVTYKDWSTYSADITLTEGINTIRAIAFDKAGNSQDVTRIVVLDTQSPFLDVSIPGLKEISGFYGLTNQPIDIIGNSEFGATVRLYINGQPALAPITIQDEEGPYTISITGQQFILPNGVENIPTGTTVYLKNDDILTYTISDAEDFNIAYGETTQLSLDAIGSFNYVLNQGNQTNLDSFIIVTRQPENSFGYLDVPLSNPVNSITIVSTDQAENTQEWTEWVLYDDLVPRISFLQPGDGSTVTTMRPEIEVLFEDDIEVNDSLSILKINGLIVNYDITATMGGYLLSYVPNSDLADQSWHNIEVTAYDISGNSNTQSSSFYINTNGPNFVGFYNCMGTELQLYLNDSQPCIRALFAEPVYNVQFSLGIMTSIDSSTYIFNQSIIKLLVYVPETPRAFVALRLKLCKPSPRLPDWLKI